MSKKIIKGDIDLDSEGLLLHELPDLSGVIVHGDYWLSGRNCAKILSMRGSPEEVTGSFLMRGSAISDLTGSPRIVGETFNISYSKNLASFSGAPEKAGEISAYYCPKITSLKGLENTIITGRLLVSYCGVTSLEGCPKKIPGDFFIVGNPGKFTEAQVRAVCEVGGIVAV